MSAGVTFFKDIKSEGIYVGRFYILDFCIIVLGVFVRNCFFVLLCCERNDPFLLSSLGLCQNAQLTTAYRFRQQLAFGIKYGM